jgi:hypothetical protein
MILVDLLDRLLMLFGGKTTTRSATAEYGPPPGAVYRDQLARYTDAQLYARDRSEILAEVRAAERRRKVTPMTANPAPRGAAARIAERAAAAAVRQREMEDRVLATADALHPADDCLIARQIRETAASIRDHREVTG